MNDKKISSPLFLQVEAKRKRTKNKLTNRRFWYQNPEEDKIHLFEQVYGVNGENQSTYGGKSGLKVLGTVYFSSLPVDYRFIGSGTYYQ